MLLLDYRPSTHTYQFSDDGLVPNSELPAVIYHNVINITGLFREQQVRDLSEHIRAFGWHLDWANTDAVYRYTHYHSTAHEALVVLEGRADIQLGGRWGREFTVHAGDMIVIPAGVAHRRLRRGTTFAVAGLYPIGQKWDLLRLGVSAYNRAKRIIPKVPLPTMDPLYGTRGPLMNHWQLSK